MCSSDAITTDVGSARSFGGVVSVDFEMVVMVVVPGVIMKPVRILRGAR